MAGKGSGGFNVGSICHDICDKRVAGTVEGNMLSYISVYYPLTKNSEYLFFFTDPMTLQPHDTDVKALTRLAGVENIVFCCNRSTADHIITSPLFTDPTYERIHPDYTNYTQRFENKGIISEAVEQVKKRRNKSENNISK